MSELDYRREKDAPLRQDIRTLGNALGRAIQQYGGETVFKTVEQLRSNCKRLRDYTERLEQASPLEKLQFQGEIDTLTQ